MERLGQMWYDETYVSEIPALEQEIHCKYMDSGYRISITNIITILGTKNSNVRISKKDTSQTDEVNHFVNEINDDWLRNTLCVEDQNT